MRGSDSPRGRLGVWRGPDLKLYRSNRSERLVERLAQVVGGVGDPFVRETIVVQSLGMRRWLSVELARRLSVWTNAEFPLPRRAIADLETTLLGPAPEGARFTREAMTWSIASRLPSLLARPEFAPLAHYLEHDAHAALRLPLAQRIAEAFDDYLVYRPDWLAQWDAGAGEGWEPVLWRELVRQGGQAHPSARLRALIEALRSPELDAARLPQRLCLFGIASLPPLFLEIFAALAQRCEVHCFVFSPSREYWADLRRTRGAEAEAEVAEEHPLLAAQGLLGRDFQWLLEEQCSGLVEEEIELYEDPGEDTLLHAVQSDVLNLRRRGAGGIPRAAIAAGDESISIQVCHGPLREVEVLHDWLAARLDADPSLEPEDIVVMSPDIETHAPYVEAVFGQHRGRPRLPFSLSQRWTSSTGAATGAFFQALDLLAGRLEASAVLDLLACAPLRERFGLDDEAFEVLRGWLVASGVRWGEDAEHRAAEGQPAHAQNTWRFGLDRLLLGVAMPEHGPLFGDCLPCDGAEGSQGELLAVLAGCCERLFALRRACAAPQTLPEWQGLLGGLLDDLFAPTHETLPQLQAIRTALATLVQEAQAAGFAEPIGLVTLRALLKSALRSEGESSRFLSGGITFCQMQPLRSIPFRVICLLGLNDEVFPRSDRRPGFHRMAFGSERRRGDRLLRDDDRYLFLEALLDAREHLRLGYVGRSVRDNRVLPPSVVLGDLLDALHEGFLPETGGASREALEARLATQHPLHAFSPRYFGAGDDPRLFSYARHLCSGASALGVPRAERAFFRGRVAALPEQLVLDLDDAARWLTRPIELFLKHRLGIVLDAAEVELPDREALSLDGREMALLGDEILRRRLAGESPEDVAREVQGRGILAPGTPGRLQLDALVAEVALITAAHADECGGARLPALPVVFEHAGVRIEGVLRELFPGGQVAARFSKGREAAELRFWLQHLLLGHRLSGAPDLEVPPHGTLILRGSQDKPKILRFAAVPDAARHLAELAEILRLAQVEALPFAPKEARAYFDKTQKEPARPEHAERAAQRCFDDAEHGGASGDAPVRRVYPDAESFLRAPTALGLADLAPRIFAPLARALGETGSDDVATPDGEAAG